MSYEVRVDHPDSDQRAADGWAAWNLWAKEHAPYAGVGIDQQARILGAVCPRDASGEVCAVLDQGGVLTAPQTRLVLQLAGPVMNAEVRDVYEKAKDLGYGVKVEFARGAFGAPSASEYREKEPSA